MESITVKENIAYFEKYLKSLQDFWDKKRYGLTNFDYINLKGEIQEVKTFINKLKKMEKEIKDIDVIDFEIVSGDSDD